MNVEKSLLGACMIDHDAFVSACEYIGPDTFSEPQHRKIFQAMLDLDAEGKPIDLVTLAEQLEGEVHATYLSELAQYPHTTAHAEHHARMLAEEYQEREAMRVFAEAHKKVSDGREVSEVISWVDARMATVMEQRARDGLVSLADVAHERWEQYEEMARSGEGITGISTGFDEIDRVIGGLAQTEMHVLAARPGVGKSALAANIAVRSAKKGNHTAVFSLEMDRTVIFDRVLAAESGLNVRELRTGKFGKWQQASEGLANLTGLPIWLNDDRTLTTSQIRAQCRRLHKQHGLDLVIVDYLQLLRDRTGEERHREVGLMVKNLRSMTKDFDGSILLLAQLNRRSEQENRRPKLSDLRESGEIEQDSDVIMFLHPQKKSNGAQPVELIIGKNRNGPTGIVNLMFEGQHTRFVETDWRHQ